MVRGSVVASSREAASENLASSGLFPLTVEDARPTAFAKPLTLSDTATGLRILATLIETGIPLRRALVTFETLAPHSWTPFCSLVQESVRQGATLGDALSVVPMHDGPTLLAMVRAGERAGKIGSSLLRAASLSESAQEVRDSILMALAYPLVLFVAGSVSLTLLLGVVVPRFSSILSDLGQELPPLTAVLIQAGHLVRQSAIPGTIVFLLVLVVAKMRLATHPGARQSLHRVLYSVPVLGAIRHSVATAKVSGALAELMESGLPLAAAMTSAAEVSGDEELIARMKRARERLTRGAPLGAALREERVLTAAAVQLVRAGEESGRPVDLLRHAARIEEAHARRAIHGGIKILEPALILTFASVVAIVATALLQAVYAVRPA
jgi:general secretion pathway protein F